MRLSRMHCLLTSLVLAASLQAAELTPPPPKIDAKSFLLIDHHSNRVLAESNADARIEPASLTKIMSAYVIMQQIKNGRIRHDDMVLISEKAWRMQGSKMFVEVNKRVPLKDLMLGVIVQSGNDATIALAEHAAGSEDSFAALMNQYAKTLGMHNSHFTNSTGWPDPNHYSTARDMASVASALIREFPAHYELYKVKEYTYHNIWQYNRNPLLKLDADVDGVKTGHTDSAGYCLVASALKNNMRLISVVTGASSEKNRENASLALLNYGYRFFETVQIQLLDNGKTNPAVYKGEKNSLTLGLGEPFFVTVPRGKRDKVQTSIEVNNAIVAPVLKGKQYGKIEIKLDDQVLGDRPLVAMEEVSEGGLWRRTVDSIKLWFE